MPPTPFLTALLLLASSPSSSAGPALSTEAAEAARTANRAGLERPHEICPSWSPSGDRIAFQMRDGEGNYDIYTVGADGRGLTRWTSGPAKDGNVTWARGGASLVFHSGIARTMEWDVHEIEVAGGGRRALTRRPGRETHPDLSGRGVLAYQGLLPETRDSEVFLLGPDGTSRNLTERSGFDGMPHWFSDDRRLLISSRFESNDLVVIDTETGERTRWTETPDVDEYPHGISADDRIVFYWAVDRSGEGASRQDLFSLDLENGSTTRWTNDAAVERCPSPSPDGTRLAFGVDDEDLAVLDLATGRVERLGVLSRN